MRPAVLGTRSVIQVVGGPVFIEVRVLKDLRRWHLPNGDPFLVNEVNPVQSRFVSEPNDPLA